MLADLRAAMEEHGLDPGAVEVTEVRTLDDAKRLGFVGSPTIRVEGVDVDPSGADEPAQLTCRIYRRRDGRASPLPDPEEVRETLRTAIEKRRR